MSARVLNPVVLSEFYKIRSPAVRSHIPSTVSLAKIKRDLFGPVDKEDSKRFVDTELAKHQMASAKRWGFDFVRGFPVAENKQFAWERVPPTNAVPEMYTLSRVAHSRDTASTSAAAAACVPTLEDLLDERAERSNRVGGVVMDTSSSEETASSCDESTETSRFCPAMDTSSNSSNSQSSTSIREKRQPKITDYLKERKRLAPTPKKMSPSKRSRNSTISFALRQ